MGGSDSHLFNILIGHLLIVNEASPEVGFATKIPMPQTKCKIKKQVKGHKWLKLPLHEQFIVPVET